MVLGFIFKMIPTYGNITRLAAFIVGLVFPTLESFKAIESHDPLDDVQWLMYWVCYITLTTIESFAWGFLIWVPFYRAVRVLALMWLAMPQFRGATFMYHQFVRPLLLVAVEQARQLPALEPYVRGFVGGKDFEVLKREAVQKVEESFEKAKQGAASLEAEVSEPAQYQPLKSHAQ